MKQKYHSKVNFGNAFKLGELNPCLLISKRINNLTNRCHRRESISIQPSTTILNIAICIHDIKNF